MGYYTDYTLSLSNVSDNEAEALQNSIVNMGFETRSNNFWCNDTWYNHDEDMLSLSSLFPKVLFDLFGDGEDTGDIWHTYYKGGKMQHCPAKIRFEPFDETKLKCPANEDKT